MLNSYRVGEPIKTPESALELYSREKNRIFRPATFAHQVVYDDAFHYMVSGQVRSLNNGQGNYRGFTTTRNADLTWYNAKRIPLANAGEYYYRGNCNDWSVMLLVRLLSLGVCRGALSLALGWVGRDARLASLSKHSQGHMVLVIHTTRGDLVACSLTGLNWCDADRLDDHYINAMEWGSHWRRVTSRALTLEDFAI